MSLSSCFTGRIEEFQIKDAINQRNKRRNSQKTWKVKHHIQEEKQISTENRQNQAVTPVTSSEGDGRM